MMLAFVITTVNPPTVGVQTIASKSSAQGLAVIVIGDTTTPSDWNIDGTTFLSVRQQTSLAFETARSIPERSYTRKMIGYLAAFATGAYWIRETDDDNIPYEIFFDIPPEVLNCRVPTSTSRWINPYPYFSDRFVWPRGLPLSSVHASMDATLENSGTTEISGLMVTQGLADGDPDVDAIYRLTGSDISPVTFERNRPLVIPHEKFSPFNSQVTTWPRALLPLMYLPTTCSFRMTDIWRSFVAQRLMPSLGATLVISGPQVHQDRNEHDLMRDFREEIEGYVGHERFVDVLESTPIGGGFENLLDDLRLLYSALIDAGFFTSAEMLVLDAWIADMKALGFGVTE